MKSVREIIKEIQIEVGNPDMTPARASEILNILSSLLGNVNDNISAKQMIYNQVLLKKSDELKTVAKARLVAEASPFYSELLDAKNLRELVIEMMRSMKYFLKAKEQEFREARY